MSAVDEIKAAAAKLHPDEQFELFRWWIASPAFRQRQLSALKDENAKGIELLDQGRYQNCDDSNVMQLAESIGRLGRERLTGKTKNPEA